MLFRRRGTFVLATATISNLLLTTTTRTVSVSAMAFSSSNNNVALGAGCYWGTEKFIVKDFQELYPNSIKKAAVGFMSADSNAPKDPSYRQVCSGSTGHVEVLDVELTNSKHFENLIKFFFQFHDPTTKNRQGNDAGSQYASVIFCRSQKQADIANKVKSQLQKLLDEGKITRYAGKTIVTDIVVTDNEFYPAHDDHQQYLEKNPSGYCNHFYRFKKWPTDEA